MATAKEKKKALDLSNFQLNIALDKAPVPQAVFEHIKKTVLSEDHLGWFNEKIKNIYSVYCCACQKLHKIDCRPANIVRTYIPQRKPMHLETRECPNCKNDIIIRKKGRAKGYTYWKGYRLCYFQNFSGIIIARFFFGNRHYNESNYMSAVTKKSFCEYARIVFRPEGVRQYNKIWSDSDWSLHNINTYLYDYGIFQKKAELKNIFKETYLSKTTWLDTQFKSIFSLYKFATWPVLEYLQKLGYEELVGEIITGRTAEDRALNLYKNKANEVLGVPHSILQKYNPKKLKECDIKAIKQLIAFGRLGQLTPERFQFISSVIDTKNSLGSLDIFRSFGIEKVLNYIDKQTIKAATENPSDGYCPSRRFNRNVVWRDFQDYRSECHTLGYDLTDEGVMFPRDLYLAHARTSELIAKKEVGDKILETIEKFQAAVKPYLKKTFSDENYLIRVAETPAEFVKEGKALKLCLWSNRYDKRVAAKTSLIFFIRRAVQPDKPYCALELNYNTKNIVQCRIFGNINAPPEVYEFIKTALPKVLSKKKASA